MEDEGGARKHIRAIVVAGDTADGARWAASARDDLSLDVRHAGSVADALRIAETRALDVAIVGTTIGEHNHRDVLRALTVACEDLPVVIVGDLEHDAIRDALSLGAIDVVALDDLGRLGASVARALRDGLMAALLRRTRGEATLLDETLRRLNDDLVVAALDGDHVTVVYATRSDVVGRSLFDLSYVRAEADQAALREALQSGVAARLAVAGGALVIEPVTMPPHDRKYVAVAFEQGGSTAIADRDALTDLPQRVAFERAAAAVLATAAEDNGNVAVMFVDVDRFRAVNELGGHAAGDAVLCEIAERLRKMLPNAFVARFGGDEFVVLRRDDGPGGERNTVDAIVRAFEEPFQVGTTPVFLTASIGVALSPHDAADAPALIGSAEAAVYEAKRFGRNNVRWYAAPLSGSTTDRVLMRRDLQGAIERDEFELYYQPMYDVETRAIHGVEALIRWRHPMHGLVLPDRFIPIAEECGLIEQLGEWVLDSAVKQVRAWADSGIPAVRVSVNVSARQLESGDLPGLVGQTLMRHDVPPNCLELEITESSIMRDVTSAARLLHDLRDLGVRVSIDDFGTGFTSLGFLKQFPVDVLKIDRTFVADVAGGGFDGAVVRAVTTLARGLGVRTVAEGVEVVEQFERLRALDCDIVQGFLFSVPLTAEACGPLLHAAAVAAA